MNFPVTEALPFTRLILAVLLHFVWQATLLIGLVALMRSLIHPRFFQVRYTVSVIGLIAVLLAPVATFGYYIANPDALTVFQPPSEAILVEAAMFEPQSIPSTLEAQFQVVFQWFDNHRFFWLGCWLIGLTVLLIRLSLSLGHCVRLRRRQKALPARLQKVADRIKQRLNITRRVIVASSQEITQAVATGIIRPVVLVPAAWLTELPITSIEAVLAHELSHIKRWDLWVNLLQRLAETMFFFHPLVWWISRKITSEREICCDHLAVQLTGEPMRYVETLAQVAGTLPKQEFEFQFGTAFTGEKNMNLLRRAKMILEPASVDRQSPFRALTLIACLGLLISLGSYAYCTMPDPAAAVQDHDQDNDQEEDYLLRYDKDGSVELIVVNGSDGDPTVRGHLAQVVQDRESDDVSNRELAQQLRALADRLDARNDRPHPPHRIHADVDLTHAIDHAIDVEVRPIDSSKLHRHLEVSPKVRVSNDFTQRIHTYEVDEHGMILAVKPRIKKADVRPIDGDHRIIVQADDLDARQNIVIDEVRGNLIRQDVVLDRLQADRRLNPRQTVVIDELHGDLARRDVVLDRIKADVKLDPRQNVLVERIHAGDKQKPRMDVRFGRVQDSDDGDLNRALRDLRNEVNQLRKELNQLRGDQASPSDASSRYFKKKENNQGAPLRFDFKWHERDDKRQSPSEGTWEYRLRTKDSEDSAEDHPEIGIWVEGKKKNVKIDSHALVETLRKQVPGIKSEKSDANKAATFHFKKSATDRDDESYQRYWWIEDNGTGTESDSSRKLNFYFKKPDVVKDKKKEEK